VKRTAFYGIYLRPTN